MALVSRAMSSSAARLVGLDTTVIGTVAVHIGAKVSGNASIHLCSCVL